MTSLLCVAFLAVGVVRVQAEDFDARARELVGKMTLQEKTTELHGFRDATHYRYVPPIPRLKIPALNVANGPAGVGPAGAGRQNPATALPAPILLAATWDVELAHHYGVIIGKEAQVLQEDLLEGPDVNIARVPQNGRTFEAFGEDPFLVGQMGVSEIKGIQSQGIIANVKHYVANNQEVERLTINTLVGERALHEIYLPAFEMAVKDAHVASLMGAYPKVNGAYCCENDELLKGILKKEWNFRGFITSDFGAVHSTVPTALAGLDLEMPTGKYFGSALEEAVNAGNVPMSVIDDKLVRRFRTMMEYGVFDHPKERKPIPAKEHGAVARQIAEEGMVLLKNDGNLLPLSPSKLHTIAVIGRYAERAMTGGGGSSHVVPLYTVDPIAGIEKRVGSNVKVTFANGRDIEPAVALAKSADVAIVMVGDRETEGRDHPLTLRGNQDELVEAVAAANPHMVVVLKSGSVMLMPWLDKVPALLEAWYPGEEDGNAVAAVLFGDVNPSGKLPITFPRKLTDLPANTPEQYPGVDGAVHYSEGIFVGYRHFDAKNIEPLFPFGYGLSYTTFAYWNLKVAPTEISSKDTSQHTLAIDLEVKNTGNRTGKEIVQVYLGFPSTSELPQAPKQLKAFAKVSLKAGRTHHVHLELDPHSLATWDTSIHGWKVIPGKYNVMVGSSSRDILLQGSLTVKAD